MLRTYDRLQHRHHLFTADYLLHYFNPLQEPEGSGKENSTCSLSYNPNAFDDFSISHCGEDLDDQEGREETRNETVRKSWNLRRRDASLADEIPTYYHLEDVPDFNVATYRVQAWENIVRPYPPGKVIEVINGLHGNNGSHMRKRFGDVKGHENESTDMYALDRRMFLDIIEYGRDFEKEVSSYRPLGATF